MINCLIEKFFSRFILKKIMSSSKNLEFEKKTAFLSKSNSAFIEEMYLKFVNNDPNITR